MEARTLAAPGLEVPTVTVDDSRRNLIVNYLPSSLNQEGFKALFSPFGELESCKLMVDKTDGKTEMQFSTFLLLTWYCRPLLRVWVCEILAGGRCRTGDCSNE
jgi:hypothetical protein